jgi:3-oxoadipate enol-lactonase
LLGPAQGWRDRAATVLTQGTGAVAGTVVQRWFTAGFAAEHPATVAQYRAMIASTPALGYAGCCLAIAEMDLRPDLPRITAPTLVLAGAQDPSTSPEHLQVIVDGIPGAKLEILDPAAHLASTEQPERVNAALLQHFLPSTDVAADPRTDG